MEADGSVPPISIHPETLKEQPPELVLNLYENVVEFIATNGWYLLVLGFLLVYLWPKLQAFIDKCQKERERKAEDAAHHKNPELYRTRQLAMEVARQRLQAEHDARAKLAEEKALEREAAKTRERLAKHSSQSVGQRLDSASKETKGTKPEYNPLMGAGPAAGYRPSRRSCPGGGCG